jgi:hypothetical protein
MQCRAGGSTAPERWDVSGHQDGGASGRSRARLWRAIRHQLGGREHELGPGPLGEYALLLHIHGQEGAAHVLPAIAAHLARGCASCRERLEELGRVIAADPESVGANPSDSGSTTPGLPC